MKNDLKHLPETPKKEKVDTGKIYLEYLKKKNKKPEKDNGKKKS